MSFGVDWKHLQALFQEGNSVAHKGELIDPIKARVSLRSKVKEEAALLPHLSASLGFDQGWTGQRKSASSVRVTVTSPAAPAANTASSEVSRYGVTPALNVTVFTAHAPP